jgi:pimeloyl-ACP methyl ester carboxylesterase
MSSEIPIAIDFRGSTLKIAAKVRTSGSELLLFLHGFGCTKESFDAAFTEGWFDPRFALCAFDFPGHGKSDPLPSEDDLIDAYAQITLEVIRQIPHSRVHLVCHSMGGAVGLIATKDLDDVGAFVSVEGNLVAEDCGIISRSIAEQTPEHFRSDGFEHGFVDNLRTSPEQSFRAWAKWAYTCDPAALHQAAQSLVSWCDRGELAALYQNLDQVTYMYGAESGLPEHLLPYVESRVRRIDRSGHFPMLDNPKGFYAALVDLVQQQVGGIRSAAPITD